DVRRDQRGEHEDADGRVRVVADLVRALLAARERDDVALAQLPLALVRARRRLAAEDDRPFLVRVVGVKWPLLVTRLDLVHARADQLGVGVRADPGVLEAPALALFRAIPLVCVEIEDLHAASLVVIEAVDALDDLRADSWRESRFVMRHAAVDRPGRLDCKEGPKCPR